MACPAACTASRARPPVAAPHYVLGDAYQADGHWYYPAENYALDSTGIAAVPPGRPGLTADGEVPIRAR